MVGVAVYLPGTGHAGQRQQPDGSKAGEVVQSNSLMLLLELVEEQSLPAPEPASNVAGALLLYKIQSICCHLRLDVASVARR